MEYLFVKRFLAMPVVERQELSWTDQMKRFLWEIAKANKQKLLNLTKADLLGLAELVGIKSLSLRHEPKTLSLIHAQEMIKRIDFFDSSMNKNGHGIAHAYVSFVRENQTLVLDLTTALIWQQSGSSDSSIWANGDQYARDLNQKRFAGYDDWRLPTLEEAMSLMEREQKNGDLYIDPIFDRTQRCIWTSDKESAGWRLLVGFYTGKCGRYIVGTGDDYVRAVRSGQSVI
ncbi:MAG: DUF1566 domain-containing protein [bacterium]